MKNLIFCLLITLTISGCRKLSEVGSPKNQLTTDKVFADTGSANAALGNIYAQLNKTIQNNLIINMDLYADNLIYTGSTTQILEFYRSKLSTDNTSNLTLWQNLYLTVYECNDLIEQVSGSTKLSVPTVQQMTGEALFLRAYSYFLLVNLYGKVPLITNTNVNANAQASQVDESVVNQQILSDLTAAANRLTADYPGGGRVRANTWAAQALLAKIYLFQKNWPLAESSATAVINSNLYSLSSCANTFLANSNETILQFWNQNGFVSSAVSLAPSSNTSLPQYPVTNSLLNSFENGDLRKVNWLGYNTIPIGTNTVTYAYYYKYKNRMQNSSAPEYSSALRIAELYLIRAEARANQNKLFGSTGAEADVNIIRNRAGLMNTKAIDKTSILSVIKQERRVELFGEWASRFFDLKRYENIDVVIGGQKNTWISTASALPIPLNELTYDSHLIQNSGY